MSLADQRRAAGLTQQQAADLMGVDRVTVARWETGSQMPVMARRLWSHIMGVEPLPFSRHKIQK